MLFNSLSFLIFFPLVVLLYFAIGQKYRWIWLLFASYYFYMSWNAVYGLLLMASTVVTYFVGLFVDKYKNQIRRRKLVLILGLVINLGILAYYKYFVFIADNINAVLSRIGISLRIPVFDILLPVGISFYTFQALGYAIDVYRGETKVEKNIFRYALFVSFFPQLVAGPIERSNNLLKQIQVAQPFKYERFQKGLMMMAYGYFLKVVMADNIAIVVNTVYGDISRYKGAYLLVATVLFAFQIYGDFGGYSMIAIGAARVMGFDLMENFNAPYLSQSVTEFWHRWHISLSQWFRDYLYIPLGGNRKGTVRKYFNVMVVFLLSGLWHGASWNYVIWGGLNGLFQVIEGMCKKLTAKVCEVLNIKTELDLFKAFKVFVTFILVDFTWLFFRAGGAAEGFKIVKSIFSDYNIWVLFDGSLYNLGLGEKAFRVMLLAIVAVLIYDYEKVKGLMVYDWLSKQQFVFRLVVYVFVVAIILTFGAWGGGFNENTFLYFQF